MLQKVIEKKVQNNESCFAPRKIVLLVNANHPYLAAL
jgi:hypothetical protein